jgi:hypothetical protein
MSKEIREQIEKIKSFGKTLNEEKDFILNNDTVKNYSWTSNGKQHNIKYSLSRDVFTGLYTAQLLGGEFDNTHGQGKTEEDAVLWLKLRLIQLRNKRDNLNKKPIKKQ